MRRWVSIWIGVVVLLGGCGRAAAPEGDPLPAAERAVPAVADQEAPAVVGATPAPINTGPLAAPTHDGQRRSGEAAVEPITELSFGPPLAPLPPLARAAVTDAQRETAAALETNLPPDRDDILLAVAYRGLAGPPAGDPPPVSEPLPVGTIQQLVVSNTDINVNNVVDAELKVVGEHAYFWFDLTPGNKEPTAAELSATAAAFDEIYEQVIRFFGSEANPGVDGDPRIHVVNASPLTICDVTLSSIHACGLLGYFSSRDTIPTSVDPRSNGREMFVMNGSYFGGPTYLDTLAHEFRHMIEDNYDVNDIDWSVEGSAMLAEDLLGFEEGPINRANAFLANPDQQLNRWTDGNPLPYYGQGYLLSRYIYDRLGTDLYRIYATHPLPGLRAVTAVAEANGLPFTGLDVWRDWLVAKAIHDREETPPLYDLPAGLRVVQSTGVNSFPFAAETTVNQFAADYFRLFGEESVTVRFDGSTLTPLLQVQPRSGERMWVANRANNSHARLTRSFDLSGVSSATLSYSVYRDIEIGYDFGYASVSLDGGRVWHSLDAAGMDGLNPADNPGEAAFTERFYTGRGSRWIDETVDLTPYAGREILIRFEYVTDPILTFEGLAVDNIAIPEIGFVDDAERDQGWTAEGFVRAAGYLPQGWHLQLVTFVDERPVVQAIPLDDAQSAEITVDVDPTGGGRPILIVAAAAPMTLNPAHYRLEVIQN